MNRGHVSRLLNMVNSVWKLYGGAYDSDFEDNPSPAPPSPSTVQQVDPLAPPVSSNGTGVQPLVPLPPSSEPPAPPLKVKTKKKLPPEPPEPTLSADDAIREYDRCLAKYKHLMKHKPERRKKPIRRVVTSDDEEADDSTDSEFEDATINKQREDALVELGSAFIRLLNVWKEGVWDTLKEEIEDHTLQIQDFTDLVFQLLEVRALHDMFNAGAYSGYEQEFYENFERSRTLTKKCKDIWESIMDAFGAAFQTQYTWAVETYHLEIKTEGMRETRAHDERDRLSVYASDLPTKEERDFVVSDKADLTKAKHRLRKGETMQYVPRKKLHFEFVGIPIPMAKKEAMQEQVNRQIKRYGFNVLLNSSARESASFVIRLLVIMSSNSEEFNQNCEFFKARFKILSGIDIDSEEGIDPDEEIIQTDSFLDEIRRQVYGPKRKSRLRRVRD